MHVSFERAREGDPRATDNLVESLRPRIVKMAAYYARHTGEDADDLLQEAWLGLLEALPGLDVRIGRPECYLVQRARWRLLDAIKRARVRHCMPLEPDAAERISCMAMETALAAASVSDFAARLKATQKAVLACLLVGLTWREAGDALGCTSANIAYHVRQIRRQYAEWSDDPSLTAERAAV